MQYTGIYKRYNEETDDHDIPVEYTVEIEINHCAENYGEDADGRRGEWQEWDEVNQIDFVDGDLTDDEKKRIEQDIFSGV